MHPSPFDFLLEFFNRFDEGKIFLSAGTHVHKIHTKSTPQSVWLSENNAGNLPVCQGNVNLYGVTVDEDGFELYAEVSSDTVELSWTAIME